MRIVKETPEADIIRALLDKHIQDYLDNEKEYLENTLEKNIVFWARALKKCIKSAETSQEIYWALRKWKNGDPITLSQAEDSLTEDDKPICGICGKGLWE